MLMSGYSPPKKGEIWMRWGALVTILDVISLGGSNSRDLIQFMHPEGTIGTVDKFTWRENVRSGKIALVLGLEDV
jgi:hypothetical protein|tara:strand:- start:462 stop:686 length:225 start_codon:yes stop_codon:yes gene_type:complete